MYIYQKEVRLSSFLPFELPFFIERQTYTITQIDTFI